MTTTAPLPQLEDLVDDEMGLEELAGECVDYDGPSPLITAAAVLQDLVPVAELVQFGTCLEGCKCPRWHHPVCGRWWAGSPDHRCIQLTTAS